MVQASVRDYIPDFLRSIIQSTGYPDIAISITPSSGFILLVSWFFYVFFCWLQKYWSHSSVVPNRVMFGETFRQVFLSFLPECVKIILSYSVVHPINSHVYSFILMFHSQCYLSLCCLLSLVFVVVGDPFLIGHTIWMFPYCSFQTILPIPLQCLMPWYFS